MHRGNFIDIEEVEGLYPAGGANIWGIILVKPPHIAIDG
jgi:hypothetical protein